MTTTLNSDSRYRKAKSTDKPYTISDVMGLCLLVHPNGSKYWMLRYTMDGKRIKRHLGVYPQTPLRGYFQGEGEARIWIPGARDIAEEIHRTVAAGIAPPKTIKPHKQGVAHSAALPTGAETTSERERFHEAAEAWFEVQARGWSESNQANILQRLHKDIIPVIGKKPIDKVTTEDLLEIYKTITDRGSDILAIRVIEYAERVLRFRGISNISVSSLREQGHIVRRRPVRHHPARVAEEQFARLLRDIESDHTRLPLRLGLKLLALLFCRPGALQRAEWSEFDLEKRMWTIPGDRVGCKRKKHELNKEHVVPLSDQSLKVLTQLREISGDSKYVFPSKFSHGHPVSNAAFGNLLKELGYHNLQTPHGFRASAKTIMLEELGASKDVIEAQLGHAPQDRNGRAYNRTEYIRQRRELMQQWADYLDVLLDRNIALTA